MKSNRFRAILWLIQAASDYLVPEYAGFNEFSCSLSKLHAEGRLCGDERPQPSDIPASYPANRRHISSMSLFLM
jgi:hypothetical protein